jgi:flagellar FliL protein
MAKMPKTEGGADEAGNGTASPAAKKGASRKKMMLIGAAALVLTAGAGGAWFAFGRSDQDPAASAEMRKPVAFVDIREMTINLAPEPNDDRLRLLKFRVALEVKDAGIVKDIQPLLPRVEDSFQVFVRELRASDLEGSSGVYRLREELLRRVNIAVYPAKVDAVLFKDIVVQ